jgi:hypothetical protein
MATSTRVRRGSIAAAVLVLIILVVAVVRVVPLQQAYVVELFGRYRRTLQPGIHLLVPLVESVRAKVNMREQVASFPPRPAITSDNLVACIETVLYYRVVDPVRATYEMFNPVRLGHPGVPGGDQSNRDRLAARLTLTAGGFGSSACGPAPLAWCSARLSCVVRSHRAGEVPVDASPQAGLQGQALLDRTNPQAGWTPRKPWSGSAPGPLYSLS